MVYIPVTGAGAGAATPRAQRLAARLVVSIDEFRKENPELSAMEIFHALQIARRSQTNFSPRMVAVIAVSVAALFAALGLSWVRSESSGSGPQWWFPIIPGVIMAAVVVALVLRRRNQ